MVLCSTSGQAIVVYADFLLFMQGHLLAVRNLLYVFIPREVFSTENSKISVFCSDMSPGV